MSHFAQVKNGIVKQVIVAEQGFIDIMPDANDWVKTSYNTRGNVHYNPNTGEPDDEIALRKNYAGIGYNWDGTGFYPPQPYPSWSLNKTTYLWQSPIPYPTDGNNYYWDESKKNWTIEQFSTDTQVVSS